ncbi:MAG: STAS/SEC14 domain-containing protein [Nostocales cyanobacterium 94392]|nr:STAS/SEC14 domain-containing protein [Nostocales cyanobacterium 94392]
MIKLLSMDANNVIGILIKGNVNTPDFKLVTNFIAEVEIHYEFLRIYVEIENVKEIYLEDVFKNLEFTLSHFHRFEKQAIVIDKKLFSQLEQIHCLLTASVKVEYFAFEDKCKALCWILN